MHILQYSTWNFLLFSIKFVRNFEHLHYIADKAVNTFVILESVTILSSFGLTSSIQVHFHLEC